MKQRSHKKAFSLLFVSKERQLSPAERTFLEEHLESCTGCRADLNVHERLQKEMRPLMQDLHPTRVQIRNMLPQILGSVDRKMKTNRISGFVLTFAQVGIAVILIGLAIWIFTAVLPSQAPGVAPYNTLIAPADGRTDMLTQPSPTVTPLPTAAPVQSASGKRTEVITYTVQEGDTVFGIAEKFSLKPETVMWSNIETLGDNPHFLGPGMVLNILPLDGIHYRWEEGDSLDDVAARTGVQPEDILNWPGNHLDPAAYEEGYALGIQPGDMLVIPGGHRELIGPGFAEFSRPEWTSLDIRREVPYNGEELGKGFCEQSVSGAIGTGTFNWPVGSPQIKGNDNNGVYLSGREGDPVYASDSGVVLFSGWSNSHYGNLVIIDHGSGWQTSYGNLDKIHVGCGEYVSQGTQIGTIGSLSRNFGSEIRSGPTLKFEIIKDYTTGVNPLMYLPEPRESTPPVTQTGEKPIPTPSSSLFGRFVWQTDGQFGHIMLRPANWQVVQLGPGRAYALPNADFGQIVLRVVNYQALEKSRGDSTGSIAQLLIFEENPSLDGWTGGIEQMWQNLGIEYSLEETTDKAKVYLVQTPPTSEVQLVALVVDEQQPLTIELSFSGNQAKIDRLREEGIVDDFMVMVDSAKPIPYDPVNVEPPLS